MPSGPVDIVRGDLGADSVANATATGGAAGATCAATAATAAVVISAAGDEEEEEEEDVNIAEDGAALAMLEVAA